MTGLAGYHQLPTGFWIKDSDSSGPYVFDGASMQLVPNGPVAPYSVSQVAAGVTGVLAYQASGYGMTPSGASTVITKWDRLYARSATALKADLIYSMLPEFADFGSQLSGTPTGYSAIYFDSTAAGGGDGSIGTPYNSIEGRTFATANQVVYLKRGSVFLVTAEAQQTCTVTADNVHFIAYGDPSLPPPLITGAKAVAASAFALNGSEYRAALARTLATQCMAVCFSDSMNLVLPNGTPGSLTTGQAGADNTYVYLKDNPGATRTLYVSVVPSVVRVQASHFRAEGVFVGYGTNNSWQLAPPNATAVVYTDAILRDCGSYFAGNEGCQIGNGSDRTAGYSNVKLIRFTDEGAYNNGISSVGEDSNTYIIEAICHGKIRGLGASGSYTGAWSQGGYFNDAITAHGVGAGPWYVLGCLSTNAQENGIDLVGGPGNLDAHVGSIVLYNRIAYMGQPGLLLWHRNTVAMGNIVTFCQQDGVRIGDSTYPATAGGGVVAGNYFENCGLASGSAGLGISWQGVVFERNTVVISSGAVRSATGLVDLTGAILGTAITSAFIRANLIIQQNSGDIVNMNSSNAALIANLGWRENCYVTAVATAFHYGGTTTTFATWQSTNERSSTNFANETAAATSGTFHKPAIGSALETGGRFSLPCYDINGQRRYTGVGASASSD